MNKGNHRISCGHPKLNIIIYDEERKAFRIWFRDAPHQGWNDIYYCPTCGSRLGDD